jgi:putative ubiquitin-RnfH superfamily antitoxin RatB of RatAB toxin-antitoxin module
MAISSCYLFRAYGQVIGVAAGAAVQQSVLSSALVERLPGLNQSEIWAIIQEPIAALARLSARDRILAREGYMNSLKVVFGTVINGTGIVFSLLCLIIRAHPLE